MANYCIFSSTLISAIGSCLVHVNHSLSHTHTLTYRYKSTKAIALRQIPGEHFYGLLRASTHTHLVDLQESVLCVQVQ